MYKSILGRPLAEKITRGAYIDDFNIGQLISRAQSLYGGEDIRALYLDVPTDKETIAYRRRICGIRPCTGACGSTPKR